MVGLLDTPSVQSARANGFLQAFTPLPMLETPVVPTTTVDGEVMRSDSPVDMGEGNERVPEKAVKGMAKGGDANGAQDAKEGVTALGGFGKGPDYTDGWLKLN